MIGIVVVHNHSEYHRDLSHYFILNLCFWMDACKITKFEHNLL